MRSVLRRLNPLNWSTRVVKAILTAFYLIAAPIYIFFGLQPAQAIETNIYAELEIPSVNLSTNVMALELNDDNSLTAPKQIVGSYSRNNDKTLLIGHSSTVFQNLKNVKLDNEIDFNGQKYTVISIETKLKEDINMREILSEAETPTIILMTCAGKNLPNQDSTHRLIVNAALK